MDREILTHYKVQKMIGRQAVQYFDRLIEMGYGKNYDEVASYLLRRELDDLKRTGVLK